MTITISVRVVLASAHSLPGSAVLFDKNQTRDTLLLSTPSRSAWPSSAELQLSDVMSIFGCTSTFAVSTSKRRWLSNNLRAVAVVHQDAYPLLARNQFTEPLADLMRTILMGNGNRQ